MTTRSTRLADDVATVRLPSGAVKICGLRSPSQAEAAVLAGADLLGFIFAPARRQLSPAEASVCLSAARVAAAGRPILGVGVFVDSTADEMNAIAVAVGLDLLQLHGEEPPALVAALDRPVVKALRPRAGAVPSQIAREVERYRAAARAPIAFLLDGYSPTAAGGEGVRADWALAAGMARSDAIVLAGGLEPSNVAGAIAHVRPLAVDVSSGVETDGVKDPAKMAAFVRFAKAAFASVERTSAKRTGPWGTGR